MLAKTDESSMSAITPSALSDQAPALNTKSSFLLFSLLLLAGLAIRLPFLPYLGTSDHYGWKIWSYAGATHPPGHIYRLEGDSRPPLTINNIRDALEGRVKVAPWTYAGREDAVVYPPIIPLILGVVGHLYLAISPQYEDGPLLNAAVKMPALLADIAITCLIFLVARKRYTERFGLLASALYWLNPMSILAGPILAYQDPIYAFLLLACVIMLNIGKHAWGWVLYVLALFSKPQALLVAPMIFAASLARGSLKRLLGYISAATAVVLAIILPFILSGTVVNMIAGSTEPSRQPFLSGNNTNVWWLASYALQVRDRMLGGQDIFAAAKPLADIIYMPELIAAGRPDPKPWGLAFVLIFSAVVVLAWWSRVGRSSEVKAGRTLLIAEAAALQIYGGTMLMTQSHENHAYGAVVLLAAAWWLDSDETRGPDRQLLWLYIALSAVVFLNLLLFYGLGREIPSKFVRRDLLWVDLTVLLSVANLVIFGWWLWRWIRPLSLFTQRRRTDKTAIA
jgi:hypothetical protein